MVEVSVLRAVYVRAEKQILDTVVVNDDASLKHDTASYESREIRHDRVPDEHGLDGEPGLNVVCEDLERCITHLLGVLLLPADQVICLICRAGIEKLYLLKALCVLFRKCFWYVRASDSIYQIENDPVSDANPSVFGSWARVCLDVALQTEGHRGIPRVVSLIVCIGRAWQGEKAEQ